MKTLARSLAHYWLKLALTTVSVTIPVVIVAFLTGYDAQILMSLDFLGQLPQFLPRMGELISLALTGIGIPQIPAADQSVSLFREATCGLMLWVSFKGLAALAGAVQQAVDDILPVPGIFMKLTDMLCTCAVCVASAMLALALNHGMSSLLEHTGLTIWFLGLILIALLFSLAPALARGKNIVAGTLDAMGGLMMDMLMTALVYLTVICGGCLTYSSQLTPSEQIASALCMIAATLALTLLLAFRLSKPK